MGRKREKETTGKNKRMKREAKQEIRFSREEKKRNEIRAEI